MRSSSESRAKAPDADRTRSLRSNRRRKARDTATTPHHVIEHDKPVTPSPNEALLLRSRRRRRSG